MHPHAAALVLAGLSADSPVKTLFREKVAGSVHSEKTSQEMLRRCIFLCGKKRRQVTLP